MPRYLSRGRVSIGDDPVGKLVCEQVIPFDACPRSCGSSSQDKETYLRPVKQSFWNSCGSSEGKDRVVIYLQKETGEESPSGQLECPGHGPELLAELTSRTW